MEKSVINDIQSRIYALIDDIDSSHVDWNSIVKKILTTDLQFCKKEGNTLHQHVYFLLNQLLDILNLERNGKYWAIPYELADLFSMSMGYMAIYGDPAKIVAHRVNVNSKIKTEKSIATKYNKRWSQTGKKTIALLMDILTLHEKYDYFTRLEKVKPKRKASKRWRKQ